MRGGLATRRLPRVVLAEAVAPEPLGEVLASLVAAGALAGYDEQGDEVLVWGNLRSLEVALAGADAVETAPKPCELADHRAEYYRACRAFLESPHFRALPKLNREVFTRHSRGISWSRICVEMHVSMSVVRRVVRGARLAAKLPATTSAMPRGGGPGRPPIPDAARAPCVTPACAARARIRGYCRRHYAKAYRQGVFTAATHG